MNNDSLKSLHTALIDAQQGYEKAEAEAENGATRTILQEANALHGRAHQEIHRTLLELGEDADDSGSFMGTVHKAVISTRAAVTGIDKASLSSFASGEERILEKYTDAIADQADADVISMLRRHEAQLRELIAKMKRAAVDETASA